MVAPEMKASHVPGPDPEGRSPNLHRKCSNKITCFFALSMILTLLVFDCGVASTFIDTRIDVIGDGQWGTSLECCIVVNNARYLMNSGGFHIGHWGFVVVDIFRKLAAPQLRPDACHVILRDAVASRRRMRKLYDVARRSEYLRASSKMFKSMSGVLLDFSTSRSGFSCSETRLIRTDAAIEPHEWVNFSSYKAPELAARDNFGCRDESTEDVLIYNRRGSRNIRNDVEVTEFLSKRYGLHAKVLFPDQLSPEEQICEMTKRRKIIITPHGGQQGSLIFKRAGVAVVVISPEEALLECYRFFSHEQDLWYHIRGNVSWACDGHCSKSLGAWKNDADCNRACVVKGRDSTIDLSVSALQDVLRRVDLFEH